MTYDESLIYIEQDLTKGSVYGLSRIKELLRRLSSPEKDMKIIHIAGTNGKGSISRIILSILSEAGYNVGIFNSPYMEKRNEYLCCNGKNSSNDEYALIASVVRNAIEGLGLGLRPMSPKPTDFEFSFAMAMEYFSRKHCDFAIVECGLGGLDDATNVFEEKELSIIANIGLDHTKLLGSTIKEITKQKCGIIINNDTVIAYPSGKEAIRTIKYVCKAHNARLITPDYVASIGKSGSRYDLGFHDFDFDTCSLPALMDCLSLRGEYQKANALVALASVLALKNKGYKITQRSIRNGFMNVRWPGRYEKLMSKPAVIADGGHNPQCAKALTDSLEKEGIKKAIFVIGIMADKDYKEVFRLLSPYIGILIATEPNNDRRLSAEDICSSFMEISSKQNDGKSLVDEEKSCNQNDGRSLINEERLGIKNREAGQSTDLDTGSDKKFYIVKNPCDALRKALEIDKEQYSDSLPVIVTGSLYMMSDIRKAVRV